MLARVGREVAYQLESGAEGAKWKISGAALIASRRCRILQIRESRSRGQLRHYSGDLEIL